MLDTWRGYVVYMVMERCEGNMVETWFEVVKNVKHLNLGIWQVKP